MSLLPYSNGFHGEKIKREIHPFNVIKIICIVTGCILVLGFLYQFVISKIEDSKMINENKFVRIDGKKYHYKTVGKGNLTIVFDGDLGVNFNQWEKVIKNLEKEDDVRLFFYDRVGYGFNDSGSKQSPKEQAKDLRMILKKLGINGSMILVGEGYGSLVLTNYADLYSKHIDGMVLINPINEKDVANKEFVNIYKNQKIGRKINEVCSYFGFTRLLYKLNISKDPSGYFKYLSQEKQKEFKIFRSRTAYSSAYYDELTNVINGNSSSQKNGLIGDKHLSIVANKNKFFNSQKDLSKLTTSKENLDVIEIDNKNDVVSFENANDISTSIRQMIKKYKLSEKEKVNN